VATSPPPQPAAATQEGRGGLLGGGSLSTITAYAKGYLDALSRMLVEARLALREAELQAESMGVPSAHWNGGSSSSSGSTIRSNYLSIPSFSYSNVTGLALKEDGRGVLSAVTAVLSAHASIVSRLEGEAARALLEAEGGAPVGSEGAPAGGARRRPAPPRPNR